MGAPQVHGGIALAAPRNDTACRIATLPLVARNEWIRCYSIIGRGTGMASVDRVALGLHQEVSHHIEVLMFQIVTVIQI